MKRKTKLPAKFTERDEEDIRRLMMSVYQQVGSDLMSEEVGGIHAKDFVYDCALHQVSDRNAGGHAKIVPTEDAVIARDAERLGDKASADEIRGGRSIAKDVLEAYTEFNNPHHKWFLDVGLERMMRMANKKGIIE